mgnify:CR=1 FL=1
MVLHNPSERRTPIYQKLNHDFIFDTYEKEKVKIRLNDYKLLINLHQTDKYLTFEELRCLPS